MATSSLRVLLAENRLTGTGIFLRSLCAEEGRSLEVLLVENGSDLAQALETSCPDVALIDLTMLQPDAPARLACLHAANPVVPLILFADAANKDCAVECLSVGAKDFMLEGFIDERTMSRVLRSALGDVMPTTPVEPVRFSRAVPTEGEMQCAFTAQLEDLELLQQQSGKQNVELLLVDIAGFLQKCVRSNDAVVVEGSGRFAVQIRKMGAVRCSGILQRTIRKLKEYRPAHLSGLPAFSVAVQIQTCPMADRCESEVWPPLCGTIESSPGSCGVAS